MRYAPLVCPEGVRLVMVSQWAAQRALAVRMSECAGGDKAALTLSGEDLVEDGEIS